MCALSIFGPTRMLVEISSCNVTTRHYAKGFNQDLSLPIAFSFPHKTSGSLKLPNNRLTQSPEGALSLSFCRNRHVQSPLLSLTVLWLYSAPLPSISASNKIKTIIWTECTFNVSEKGVCILGAVVTKPNKDAEQIWTFHCSWVFLGKTGHMKGISMDGYMRAFQLSWSLD